MPFYTFKCNSCGRVFEVRCTIKEKENNTVVCPGCGACELDRIFEGFTVSVKGQALCGSTTACPAESGGGCCCGCGGKHK